MLVGHRLSCPLFLAHWRIFYYCVGSLGRVLSNRSTIWFSGEGPYWKVYTVFKAVEAVGDALEVCNLFFVLFPCITDGMIYWLT